MNLKSSDADSKERTTQRAIWMAFGKPRHDNKRIIYKQTSANRCGGYFFFKFIENSNSTCIRTWPFAWKRLKKLRTIHNEKKSLSTNFGWGINCKHERSVPTLDSYIYYITISFTDIELKSNYNSFGIWEAYISNHR